MKQTYSVLTAVLLLTASATNAQTILGEHFNDLPYMQTNGWLLSNMSDPVGAEQWHQGTTIIGAIAYSGDTTDYLEDSYLAVEDNNSGTISDWLISPPVTIQDGDSIAIWALSYNSATYPDRVEVRISPNAGSSVGADETSVGDFTNLVFSINPDLNTTDFPSVAVDGSTWGRFGGEVAGLGAPTSCRVAVRYFVTDGGFAGANSSSIGIDDLDVFSGSSSIGISEHALANVGLNPNPTTDRLFVNIGGSAASFDLNLVNAAGQQVMSDRISNNTVLDLSGFDNGVYVLEIRNSVTGAVSREHVVKQ